MAVETRLGWLIMGIVPGEKNQGVSTLAVTPLLSHNAVVAELWSYDTLGIGDPAETLLRHVLEQLHLTISKKLLSPMKMGIMKFHDFILFSCSECCILSFG